MERVYSVGDRILNADKDCSGTIRWIGKLNAEQIKCILEKSAKVTPFRDYYKETTDNGTNVVKIEVDSLNAEEIYLGIEWDDDLKGYCNGEINNIEIFDPIYSNIRNQRRIQFSEPIPSKVLSCSFVPLSKLKSKCKDFFQAVVERYIDDGEDDSTNDNVEFVGKEEAVNYFKDLNNLRIIGINGYNISIVGQVNNLVLPKLNTVEIVDNLISSWGEILKISKFAPNLSTLDMSGNKMSPFNVKPGEYGAFVSLKILYLNRTFIQFDEFFTLCHARIFPKLETVHLCNNYISAFPTDKGNYLSYLRVMNLSNNYISDLEVVFKIIHVFSTLKKLIISGNKISTIRNVQALVNYQVEHLEELHIEDNLIGDWDTIVYFSQRFRKLKSLRISGNPLHHTNENVNNILRVILISLFPKLEVLDGSSISKSERSDSECCYISLSKSRHASYALINKLDATILERLEQIHGKREDVNEDMILDQNFIELTLVPEGELCDFSKGINKRMFSSNAIVRDVKIVCSKLFSVSYSMIKLVYNVKNTPLLLELDDDFARIDQYGISNNHIIRVQHPISQ